MSVGENFICLIDVRGSGSRYLNTRYFSCQRGVIRDTGELDIQRVSHHKGTGVGFLKGQRGRYCPRTCASGSDGSRVNRDFHSDDDIADNRAYVGTVEPQEIGGRSTILFQPSR